ncbi:MAG: HU family DNA-binding protein [Candidatus Eremiobacteraeota bacterium]|nr:HU family DNA-binding protein [Candidatus Eremiobacteraeota bacterium]
MTKTELVKELAERTDLSQTKASEVVDAIFDATGGIIASQLGKGDKVVVPGFGSFLSRHRKAREARNPATGKKVKVKAKNYPVFKAGKTLKDKVEG